MDILINGLEMPKGGYRTVEIAFDADGHPMALADGGDVFDVIPVPPHGRLIDADALIRDNGIKEIPEYYEVVCAAPTIIPASNV